RPSKHCEPCQVLNRERCGNTHGGDTPEKRARVAPRGVIAVMFSLVSAADRGAKAARSAGGEWISQLNGEELKLFQDCAKLDSCLTTTETGRRPGSRVSAIQID